MKVSAIPYADAALVFSLLLAPQSAAFRCGQVVADGQRYNLEALGGPHSVVTTLVDEGRIFNTTYTVDICAPLKKNGNAKSTDQCHNGSRVCAIKRLIKGDDSDEITEVTSLAGDLTHYGGSHLDPIESRLSKIDPESGKEGLRVVFRGGFGYTETHVLRKKHTVIDFVCYKDLDGTEGEYDPKDQHESSGNLREARAEDDGNGDGDEDGDGSAPNEPPKETQLGIDKKPSLLFDSYSPSDSETNVDILHLTWRSKHVCQREADNGSDGGGDEEGGEKKPSSHWGVFTWVIILLFLGTAAYLIFGSWLNYNRYGARGWDLLPHGDTIRDIPYLMKDWVRRVLNTVQGSGSRGGYSAV